MIDDQNITKKERREFRRDEKRMEQVGREKKQSLRRAVLYSCAALVLVGVIFGGFKLASVNNSNGSGSSVSSVFSVSESDWTKGNKEAAATLIEYSDFQCPACGAYYPLVKQLSQEFGDKVLFVYRHFPLDQHKNAELASYAAEAAGKQDKFWEMHDLIFEGQKEWSDSEDARAFFAKYAASLNLVAEQFQKDIDSAEVKAKVEKDYQSGLNAKVNSTPTFFLNGKKLQNPRSYEEFKKILDPVEAPVQ